MEVSNLKHLKKHIMQCSPRHQTQAPGPRAIAVLALSLFGATALALAPGAVRAKDAAEVVRQIESKNCAGAAQQLNEALANPSAEVLVLAGSMFENGICLKQSTERAARMFLRAADAPGVGSRLAALYASKAAKGSEALAVWWGQRVGLPLPEVCGVDPQVLSDADAYARQVQAWPAGRLAQCAYVAGVLGAIDAEFVRTAFGDVQSKGIDVLFDVARGQVLVAAAPEGGEGVEAGVGTGNNRSSAPGFQRHPEWIQPDRFASQRQAEVQALAVRVSQVSKIATARVARPDGELPAWRITWHIQAERSSMLPPR